MNWKIKKISSSGFSERNLTIIFFGDKIERNKSVLVVQRIGRRPPEPEARVRFPPSAPFFYPEPGFVFPRAFFSKIF